MKTLSPDIFFYLIIFFFGTYILLQIYIILKLRTIIKHLFEILFQLHAIIRKVYIDRATKSNQLKKICQNCKFRLPYYNANAHIQNLIYYRCQLSNKKVPPDYYCQNFVLDPQTYDV